MIEILMFEMNSRSARIDVPGHSCCSWAKPSMENSPTQKNTGFRNLARSVTKEKNRMFGRRVFDNVGDGIRGKGRDEREGREGGEGGGGRVTSTLFGMKRRTSGKRENATQVGLKALQVKQVELAGVEDGT
ncbi:hypothetical protein M0802_010383 [Mischocyttarus mexicanus]|nr:hypothetical protein M0802_010383 [Mischocyttarus mexicanus]